MRLSKKQKQARRLSGLAAYENAQYTLRMFEGRMTRPWKIPGTVENGTWCSLRRRYVQIMERLA